MRYWIQIAWQYGWFPALALLGLWLFSSFSLPGIVPGEFRAMEGTLKPGRWYVVDRRVASARAWERGQVVRFRPPVAVVDAGDMPWLARIAALPGQEIGIRDGKVYVDGESYEWQGFVPQAGEQMPTLRVPAEHVFLLVDRSQAAILARLDSRAFGAIPVLSLEGALLGYR